MALINDNRVNAIYSAIAAHDPAFSAVDAHGNPIMSDAEKNAVKANLATVFGTDLTYLKANTVVSVNTSSTIPTSAISTTPAVVGTAATGPLAPLGVNGTGTGTIG